ncbi:MAG: beta-propeller fold lactonase family protein, partial [Planctomycetota bacterium]
SENLYAQADEEVFVETETVEAAPDYKTGYYGTKDWPLGNQATEATPRGFGIDARGRFLVAAGQSSNRLVVFRVGKDGRLQPMARYSVGDRPWWVEIVAIRPAG